MIVDDIITPGTREADTLEPSHIYEFCSLVDDFCNIGLYIFTFDMWEAMGVVESTEHGLGPKGPNLAPCRIFGFGAITGEVYNLVGVG